MSRQLERKTLANLISICLSYLFKAECIAHQLQHSTFQPATNKIPVQWKVEQMRSHPPPRSTCVHLFEVMDTTHNQVKTQHYSMQNMQEFAKCLA